MPFSQPVLHSYGLRAYSLRHVMLLAAAEGWPAVELSSWHLPGQGALAEAVALGNACGVRIHCAGYWGVFTDPDETARKQWVDNICALIDECAAQGVGLINGSGGWLVADPEHWDADWRANGGTLATAEDVARVAECYRRVAAYGAGRGVKVAVEVHPNTVHDTAMRTAALLELVGHDNLVVTLDPANAAPLSASDLEPSAADLLPGRIAQFHLKNCLIRGGRADFTVGAADGVVDNYRWLAKLSGVPVCVEYCGDGDPHPRLAAGKRYLEQTRRLIALDGLTA